MNSVWQDVRYAVRQLRRNKFFSAAVLLTLALSVGATAATVGVLRATLLNPLPYPEAGRLVELTDRNLRGFETRGLMSVLRTADLAALKRDGHTVFSGVGFYYSDDSTITLSSETPAGVAAYGVSDSFFSTVGSAPMLGRTITTIDGVKNAPEVVVLSEHLWRTRFAGDPNVVGRVVRLGTVQATVAGVMPEQFNFPAGTELWHHGHIAAANFAGYRGEGSRFVQVVARLGPAETLASVKQQVASLDGHLAAAFPDTDAAWAFEVTTLRDALFGDYRHALWLLAVAVGLVLLVATVNIASLQLSRNAGRAPEFAVRSALGVTRARLVRQLLTESTLLVGAGSLFGVGLAAAVLKSVVSLLPTALLRVERPRVDVGVLVFSCGLALVVGVLTGIVPAFQSARRDGALGASRTTMGRPKLLGRGFAAVQIALALVLLSLSAAVLRNLYGLLHLPLGYDAAQLQTFSVDLPWGIDVGKTHRLYSAVEQSIGAMPGVQSIGAITSLPLGSFTARRTFDIAGAAPTPHHDAVVAQGRNMSPGYLETMRIPLLSGRNFSIHDAESSTPSVVMVNRTFAEKYFPGRDAVGQRLMMPTGAAGTEMKASEIVGVTGDVRGTGGVLDAPVQPEVYYPEDGGWPHMQFAVRTTLPGAALEPALRQMIPALDASASLGHYSTLAKTLDRSLAQPRLNAGLLGSFAGLALVLVIVGVYGLIAFDVSQRVRELGLRLALGSTRASVFALLLGDAGRILAAGLALGLGSSFFGSRVLRATTGIEKTQSPALTLAATGLLALAVLAATLIPASRAARIDPIEALRVE